MQRRTLGVALAIVILIGLGAWFFWRSSQVEVAIDLVARWARERDNDARWMREQFAETESLADLMWKQSRYLRTGV